MTVILALLVVALVGALLYVLVLRDELELFDRRERLRAIARECASHGERIGELEQQLDDVERMLGGSLGIRRQ